MTAKQLVRVNVLSAIAERNASGCQLLRFVVAGSPSELDVDALSWDKVQVGERAVMHDSLVPDHRAGGPRVPQPLRRCPRRGSRSSCVRDGQPLSGHWAGAAMALEHDPLAGVDCGSA